MKSVYKYISIYFLIFSVCVLADCETYYVFSESLNDESWALDEKETLKKDETLKVKIDGKVVEMSTLDVISGLVCNEMGENFHSEALKAQAIVSHTHIVYENEHGRFPVFSLKRSSNKIRNIVADVKNIIICDENGNTAFTPYCSCVAGKTNDAMDVWGYKKTQSVSSKYDYLSPTYKKICKYSLKEVKDLFKIKWGLDISNVQSQDIFKVITRTSGGYIGKMRIGNYDKYYRKLVGKTVDITARLIREEVLSNLGSANFEVEYDDVSQEYTFISYGYGHGAGMSQYGAHFYASIEKLPYNQIILHYFPDDRLKNV